MSSPAKKKYIRSDAIPTIILTVCLFAFLVFNTAVRAEDKEEMARKAFKDGVAFFEKEDFSKAADMFRKAYELRPKFSILYNIGQAESASRRYGLAFEAFEQYLAQAGDDITVSRRSEVLSEMNRLEQMVGSLKIVAPNGAQILVDGAERGTAPILYNIKIAAGVFHDVSVVLDGAIISSQQFKVSRKETFVLTASKPEAKRDEAVAELPAAESSTETAVKTEMEAVPAKGPVMPLRKQHTEKKRRMVIAGWITLGTGTALLIGGSITGSVVLSRNADLKDSCDNGICTSSDDKDKMDSIDVLSPLSTALIITGAAVAASTIPLWLLGRSREKNTASDTSVSFVPLMHPELAGVAMVGRF